MERGLDNQLNMDCGGGQGIGEGTPQCLPALRCELAFTGFLAVDEYREPGLFHGRNEAGPDVHLYGELACAGGPVQPGSRVRLDPAILVLALIPAFFELPDWGR